MGILISGWGLTFAGRPDRSPGAKLGVFWMVEGGNSCILTSTTVGLSTIGMGDIGVGYRPRAEGWVQCRVEQGVDAPA